MLSLSRARRKIRLERQLKRPDQLCAARLMRSRTCTQQVYQAGAFCAFVSQAIAMSKKNTGHREEAAVLSESGSVYSADAYENDETRG